MPEAGPAPKRPPGCRPRSGPRACGAADSASGRSDSHLFVFSSATVSCTGKPPERKAPTFCVLRRTRCRRGRRSARTVAAGARGSAHILGAACDRGGSGLGLSERVEAPLTRGDAAWVGVRAGGRGHRKAAASPRCPQPQRDGMRAARSQGGSAVCARPGRGGVRGQTSHGRLTKVLLRRHPGTRGDAAAAVVPGGPRQGPPQRGPSSRALPAGGRAPAVWRPRGGAGAGCGALAGVGSVASGSLRGPCRARLSHACRLPGRPGRGLCRCLGRRQALLLRLVGHFRPPSGAPRVSRLSCTRLFRRSASV